MRAKRLTLQDVAGIVGAPPETVRAWERHLNIRRSKVRVDQPDYREEDVELFKQVKRAVSANGLSLRVRPQRGSGRASKPKTRSKNRGRP